MLSRKQASGSAQQLFLPVLQEKEDSPYQVKRKVLMATGYRQDTEVPMAASSNLLLGFLPNDKTSIEVPAYRKRKEGKVTSKAHTNTEHGRRLSMAQGGGVEEGEDEMGGLDFLSRSYHLASPSLGSVSPVAFWRVCGHRLLLVLA